MNFFIKRFFTTKVNQKLVESLAKLPAISNYKIQHIEEFLETTPELRDFPPELWQQSYQTLENEGFDPKKFLSIINLNPKLLHKDPVRIHQVLEQWRSYQMGESTIILLMETHPQLLEVTNYHDLTRNLSFLKNYAKTYKNVATILLNNPGVAFDKLKTLEEKVNYFKDVMKVEYSEVVKSSTLSRDLLQIKTRHIFMQRLGLFEIKKKKKKTDEAEISGNPKLYQIMDTSDKRFATKLCFVTLEEFETFVELFKKELELTTDADDSDLDSDDELD